MDNNTISEPQIPKKRNSFTSGLLFVWDFLKVIIVALIIIIPIRYFVFQPFIVSGSSMLPNFQNGQYLIVDELSYRLHDPARGDVIVLKYPKDPKEYFIKRVIGLPGEKVQIDNGHVTIYNSANPNGMVLDESYLPSQDLSFPHDNSIVGGSNILTLGPDQYFVMGDNRLYSSDSRDWGILTRSGIVGRVSVRVLPFNSFSTFSTPSYTASPTGSN